MWCNLINEGTPFFFTTLRSGLGLRFVRELEQGKETDEDKRTPLIEKWLKCIDSIKDVRLKKIMLRG